MGQRGEAPGGTRRRNCPNSVRRRARRARAYRSMHPSPHLPILEEWGCGACSGSSSGPQSSWETSLRAGVEEEHRASPPPSHPRHACSLYSPMPRQTTTASTCPQNSTRQCSGAAKMSLGANGAQAKIIGRPLKKNWGASHAQQVYCIPPDPQYFVDRFFGQIEWLEFFMQKEGSFVTPWRLGWHRSPVDESLRNRNAATGYRYKKCTHIAQPLRSKLEREPERERNIAEAVHDTGDKHETDESGLKPPCTTRSREQAQ